MATTCTRCEGTGFLNADQIPTAVYDAGLDAVVKWMAEVRDTPCSCDTDEAACTAIHDVQICDCCGDGEAWYGNPGEHYTDEDPRGPRGPYAYNGGLCECH